MALILRSQFYNSTYKHLFNNRWKLLSGLSLFYLMPWFFHKKDRKSLAPMDIVAALTKVVQQQQKKIEELEARFNERQ